MKVIFAKTIFLLLTLLFLLSGSCDGVLSWTSLFKNMQKREMVEVGGGTYLQSDGATSFTHNISTFLIAKYETTYELWQAVYQWAIQHGYAFANAGREGSQGAIGAVPTGAKFEPVTTVNRRDALVWCNAYSEASGRTPCYSYSGVILRDSTDGNAAACDDAFCDWGVDGFRLPSEGEWQFAASDKGAAPWNYAAGAVTSNDDADDTSPANGIVDGKDADDAVAVFGSFWNGASWVSTSVTKTSAVGSKSANSLALYDMSGNVWEWLWDRGDAYPTVTQNDFRGPAVSGNWVIRGGSWNTRSDVMSVGARAFTGQFNANYQFGFRVAKSH